MQVKLEFFLPDQGKLLHYTLNGQKYIHALRAFDQQLSICRQLARNGDEELVDQLDTIEWVQDLFRNCCATQDFAIWED